MEQALIVIMSFMVPIIIIGIAGIIYYFSSEKKRKMEQSG
jgi:flagellar basal body-associated protein FliL